MAAKMAGKLLSYVGDATHVHSSDVIFSIDARIHHE